MPTLDDLPIIPKNVAVKANDLLPLSDASAGWGNKAVAVPAALIGQGFTHAFRIDYNNAELVANTTNDLDETITLMAIPANSIVDKARLVVVTPFAGITALNAFVGRTADTDGYIASVDIKTAVTAKGNTGAYIDSDVETDVITASDQNLLITFDPAANGDSLDSLTAGSLVVLVSLTEIADYASIATAQ